MSTAGKQGMWAHDRASSGTAVHSATTIQRLAFGWSIQSPSCSGCWPADCYDWRSGERWNGFGGQGEGDLWMREERTAFGVLLLSKNRDAGAAHGARRHHKGGRIAALAAVVGEWDAHGPADVHGVPACKQAPRDQSQTVQAYPSPGSTAVRTLARGHAILSVHARSQSEAHPGHSSPRQRRRRKSVRKNRGRNTHAGGGGGGTVQLYVIVLLSNTHAWVAGQHLPPQ